MTNKSYLLTLAAAALLTLLPTACTDDLNGNDGTQGEGYGVPVKGISFYVAETFVEDTIAGHEPTMETNVEDGPDIDVMGRVTYHTQTEAKARRAAAANGGIPRRALEDLVNAPTLAKQLKGHKKARRSSAQDDKVVAGRKPAVPMRHKATANDGNLTRSFDVTDTTAIFVVGDSVGVYEVDGGGNILHRNVKYVLSVTGVWECATPLAYNSEHRYFAYHPYRTDAQLSELGATVGSSTASYEAFFGDLANNWPVTDDQGEYKKYHACDLLGGEATWNDETKVLGFPMHHLMGMLQLEFGTARIYLDWADERNDHYPYWWTDTVTTSLKNGMRLLPMSGGKYRRITRPGSALTVAAIDDAWVMRFTADKSISRGHYQHYDIGRTASNDTVDYYQIFYNQLGDILLQDGRLVHRHDYQRIQPNNPVGIVVGTVFPIINPFIHTVEGPIEDETYNMHSLEREYLYNMDEISRTATEVDTMVVMRPRYIRCLIMSLKDVSYDNGADVYIPDSTGAAWDYSEALSHMPNTHCVGTPPNNIWSGEELQSRVNNYWYPDISSSWKAKAACQAFNNTDSRYGCGVSQGDGVRKKTPNSGWFIGTAGQYQMAFCFGRERCWGEPWTKADASENDPDGKHAIWDVTSEGTFYNGQYPTWFQIKGTRQQSDTYKDETIITYTGNEGTFTHVYYWYPVVGNPECPTLHHDFARINNAMAYALGSNSSYLYNTLNGEYTTTTAFCSTFWIKVFFPQVYSPSEWNFEKKYWNCYNWDKTVTVQIHLDTPQRGYCYSLGSKYTMYGGKIRPLMAL